MMDQTKPRVGAAKPSHHPGEEVLLDYAIGASSPAEALVIDLHLEFCAQCRRTVDDLLAVGGALLDVMEPAFVSPQMFNKTLQAIGQNAPTSPTKPSPIPRVPTFAVGWPAPLRDRVTANRLKQWRWLPAGFRALRIPMSDGDARIWVMKAPGGRGPFKHTHSREEWTVVLQGGFTDETGKYEMGDFVSAGRDEAHHTVAEPGEGCICVLLVRAEPIYTTLPGKLLAPFVRI
jgi:putative transcriptional regulator